MNIKTEAVSDSVVNSIKEVLYIASTFSRFSHLHKEKSTWITERLIKWIIEWALFCRAEQSRAGPDSWASERLKDNLLWVIWHTVCVAESTEGREHGERAQSHMNTLNRNTAMVHLMVSSRLTYSVTITADS